MTNTDELKRLAEAATPGPWDHETKKYNETIYTPRRSGPSISVSQGAGSLNSPIWGTPAMAKADAAYIAAANPSAILSLIEEVEGLRSRLEAQEVINATLKDDLRAQGIVSAHNDEVRQRELDKLTTLRAELDKALEVMGPIQRVVAGDISEAESDDDLFHHMPPRHAHGPKLTVGVLREISTFTERHKSQGESHE